MYNLTEGMKATHWELMVSDELKKIEKRCKKWYDTLYCCVCDRMTRECETSNLCVDLDYMFAMAQYVAKLGYDMGMVSTRTMEHLGGLMLIYMQDGYKHMVAYHVNEYNWREDRPYTEQELKERGMQVSTEELPSKGVFYPGMDTVTVRPVG